MMNNKNIYSLKVAFISLILALLLLFLASFKFNINIWNLQFISCFFVGSFLYGRFIYDKEAHESIFLILAVILWMISISTLI